MARYVSRLEVLVLAKRNGWNVYDNYPGPNTEVAKYGEWVSYFRGTEQVLIVWGPDNYPDYIALISDTEGPIVAADPGAGETVRRWFESAAMAGSIS